MNIKDDLINYFAAFSMPAEYVIDDIVKDKLHSHHGDICDLMVSFSETDIAEALKGPLQFLTWARTRDDKKQAPRWLAAFAIDKIICDKRRRLITQTDETVPVKPYDHKELSHLAVDKNSLIALNNSEDRHDEFQFGGTVFHILPTLPQTNSMYWAAAYLHKLKKDNDVKVRLDPLMFQPADGHLSMFYKMFVYGVPLDWSDISSLKQERHARWMPDDPSRGDVIFTDLVWTPRDDGIHFACEEVPKSEQCHTRASRYLHAIYDPNTSTFSHTDGAVRIYTEEEICFRNDVHVRNGGKQGVRVKVFQVDGKIDRDLWCSLAASFFVWNRDIKKYFSD